MKKIIFALLCCMSISAFGQNGNVRVIYGYLYVFPNEIGVYDNEPYNIISQLNSQCSYGYSTWRVPTDEELALLRANGYADAQSSYITYDGNSRRGKVILVTTKNEIDQKKQQAKAESIRQYVNELKSKRGYINLGLPSGTKWAAVSVNNGVYISYSQASSYSLPSKSQWQELKNECTWTWCEEENGYIIKGKNGNCIFLEATNGFLHSGTPQYNDAKGVAFYWSSTWDGTTNRGYDKYYCFTFDVHNTFNHDYNYFPNNLSVQCSCFVRCVSY